MTIIGYCNSAPYTEKVDDPPQFKSDPFSFGYLWPEAAIERLSHFIGATALMRQ